MKRPASSSILRRLRGAGAARGRGGLLDLRESAADREFRLELRAWLAESVRAHGPAPPHEDFAAWRHFVTAWQRRLFDAGYAGIHWPKAFGGREASLAQQLVYHEECARAAAPFDGMLFVALNHGGPTLMVEGTPEQKARHLLPILRGDQVWCQCFSEPVAGSDLAALRTRAVRDGDHYVVNGHKIWTSFAQSSDYGELLVRTEPDAPKHEGISWLILPMDLPGIEVRPLRTVLGSSEFNEVFFEDVRVPVGNRVGAENDGWRVTNVTLRFERGTAFSAQIYRTGELIDALVRAARRVTRDDASAWEDRALRREVGRLRAELDSLWAMVKLSIAQASSTGVPGLASSCVKLVYTDLFQRAAELAAQVIGRAALAGAPIPGVSERAFGVSALASISMSIAAGTSQIQRNIISERILGLPRGA